MDSWLHAMLAMDLEGIVSHDAPDILAFDAVSQLPLKGLDAYSTPGHACRAMCRQGSPEPRSHSAARGGTAVRKVALTMSVAVDGCVGRPNGAVEWIVKRALERFDRGVTARYPQAHGCLLLCRWWGRVRGVVHACAHGRQPHMPNGFSEELSLRG